MVTIIIPTLNEAKTIGNIVRFCLKNHFVKEVIVVDDNSEDKRFPGAGRRCKNYQ